MSRWSIKSQYMPRPMASAEAWVYHVQENETPWGILVDERIRYKTLFEPGQDLHENLDEIIVPLDGRYWVKSGDWSRTLVPGEVAFIPRETVHDSGTATNLIGTHFLVLLFDVNLNVLSKKDIGGFKLPLGTITWLKGAFRFLKQSPDAQGFLPLSVLPEFFKICSPRLRTYSYMFSKKSRHCLSSRQACTFYPKPKSGFTLRPKI